MSTADMLRLRVQRERQHGVTCYEYQAMLEVDHPDWEAYSSEMQHRDSLGIGFTADEAELAIALIQQWIREDGVEAVTQTLTDIIAERRVSA